MYFNKANDYVVKRKNQDLEIEINKKVMLKGIFRISCLIVLADFIIMLQRFYYISSNPSTIVFYIIPAVLIIFILALAIYLRNNWSIKIEGQEIYITNGIKKYQIQVKDVIDCEQCKNTNWYYVRFAFKKENTIKVINLTTLRIDAYKIFSKVGHTDHEYVEEDKLQELLNYFIYKSRVPTIEESNETMYVDIRGEDENRKIEELIAMEDEKATNEMKKNLKQFIGILVFIVIATVLSFLLPWLLETFHVN